mgnify:CR=1 FL=1
MQTVKRFPTTTGQSWLEMSSFKDHMFRPHTEIEDKYDYVIVGAGYGGYGVASCARMPKSSYSRLSSWAMATAERTRASSSTFRITSAIRATQPSMTTSCTTS